MDDQDLYYPETDRYTLLACNSLLLKEMHVRVPHRETPNPGSLKE